MRETEIPREWVVEFSSIKNGEREEKEETRKLFEFIDKDNKREENEETRLNIRTLESIKVAFGKTSVSEKN